MIKIRTDISTALKELLHQQQVLLDTSLMETVQAIQKNVSQHGDKALKDYARQFDKVAGDLNLVVSQQEIAAAYTKVSKSFITALKKAKANIKKFHALQKPKSWTKKLSQGAWYGVRYTALDAVGLYVPGGRAIYPSTVLMNAIPASIAGVKHIVITTPPQPDGSVPPEILVAADLCGVSTIIKSGGAQAVFALTQGTKSVQKVDKIVGPGNRFVTLAKQMVYGQVDIDKPAGPSEVLVFIDNAAYADSAAAEALAQLEHDPSANAVIVGCDKSILSSTIDAFNRQIKTCSRQDILMQSQKNLYVLLAKDEKEALEVINQCASEHVMILSDRAKDMLPHIRHGGSIFLGPYTSVTLGDYWAGPNHVLPTSGTARFASPLGVMDFMKFSSVLQYSKKELEESAPYIQCLTQSEGFDAHFNAVNVRLKP